MANISFTMAADEVDTEIVDSLSTAEQLSYYQEQLVSLRAQLYDVWRTMDLEVDDPGSEKGLLFGEIQDSCKQIEETVSQLEQKLDEEGGSPLPDPDPVDVDSLTPEEQVAYYEKQLIAMKAAIIEKAMNSSEDISEESQQQVSDLESLIEKMKQDLIVLPEEAPAPIPLPTSSTVNAPGTAQRDALRNQMFAIRDRIANLGRQQVSTPQQQYWGKASKDGSVPGHSAKSSSPATNVQYQLWVEGNGGYTDLNEQNGRGGYRLETSGGTVGAAALLDNDLTLGAAFSAQWGDLTSSVGQEWAKGDLDSLYLHLFGHYQSNAWGHTLILTGTTTDATLNRSGVIDGEYFNTQGDTDGYGFGALYELTYDIPLNESGSTLLQPLFDVSIVHTQLDAYDETGSKALHVGKQEWTTGSVALGARLSGTFGSESWGHPFFGEVRASVSQDFGDTRGKTSIAWADNPGVSNTAYGSRVRATAVQVGAGVSTPLTSYSSVYANVGADFRQREISAGGALGVRFAF
jgi:hypothetical protein